MTDVLTYRGVELRNLAVNRHYFSITGGWRDGVEVRGTDATILGAAGHYELNRVSDKRIITLVGFVLAEDENDWDDEMAALEAIFDPILSSGDLIVTSPYMGLAAGIRTISARVANYVTVDVQPQLVTRYDVTLNAIGNPPDWIDSGS
jgi:hypothetical protein